MGCAASRHRRARWCAYFLPLPSAFAVPINRDATGVWQVIMAELGPASLAERVVVDLGAKMTLHRL